ncbi:MAG: pitrilysin family protein [Hyphomicrobiaceae bacterium]
MTRPAGRVTSLTAGAAAFVAFVAAVLVLWSPSANAMKIQTVRSPGGIEAWLVEEHKVPLLALRFAFDGGSAQDPKGRPGVSYLLTSILDEGAGKLSAARFQEKLEELAVRMRFQVTFDEFYGSFETLTSNRDAAAELLRLALNEPRFDAEALERMRKQLLASLAYAAKNPESVASQQWYAQVFKGHPYGSPIKGTPESVAAITRDDLVAFHKRVFTRQNLRIVAVGDIDAKSLGLLLDRIFGKLPAKSELVEVPEARIVAGPHQKVFEMAVPQSVARFGLQGIARKDPAFVPAFVLNHIIGGGGFGSRFMEEVREKRGLAYSVYSYLDPMRRAAIFYGGVATRNDGMAKSLEVIRAELKRIGEKGPTEKELQAAKDYLVGSFALRFDTNAKIASQLLGILTQDLGIDYVDKRNGLIQAVTIDDVRRVAKRLFAEDALIVTIVGQPKNLKSRS